MAIHLGQYMNSKRLGRSLGVGLLVCVVAASGACSLQSFNDMKSGRKVSAKGGSGGEGDGGTSGDLGGSTSEGGSGNAAGAAAAAGTNGRGGAGAGGAAGTPSLPGGGSAGLAGAAGSGPAAPTLGPFNFDTESTAYLWTINPLDSDVESKVYWVEQGEAPPLGSLACSTPTIINVTYAVPASAANQSNRTLFFRVRSESGTTSIKPFAFSAGYIWSDGGEQGVSTNWSVANIDLQSPSYEAVSYDPSQIIAVGFQLSKPGVVWIDRIWSE